MKIEKFNLYTTKDERIKLAEVENISFNLSVHGDKKYSDAFYGNEELWIISENGHLKFPLNEISNISFDLTQEISTSGKIMTVHISSYAEFTELEEKHE